MSCFSPEITQVFVGMLLLAVIVLLPLVPTIITYRFVPDTKVAASGPLAGLSIKTSGAFAAYLITFVIAYPFATRNYESVALMTSPSWVMTAELVVMDPDGKKIEDPRAFEGMQVSLEPKNFGISGGKVWVRLPEIDKRIPNINFVLPTIGQQAFDAYQPGVELDLANRNIKVSHPIVISQFRSTAPYEPRPPQGPSSTSLLIRGPQTPVVVPIAFEPLNPDGHAAPRIEPGNGENK